MYKITKLKAVENPKVQSAETYEKYRESVVSGIFEPYDEHLSPNVDYWIIGEPITELKVGECLLVNRWVRNGVCIPGRFSTSRVTKITEGGFETQNSVYKMEKVDMDYKLYINERI